MNAFSSRMKAALCCSKYSNLWQLHDSALRPRLRCVAGPGGAAGIAVPAARRGAARLVRACPECRGTCSGTRGFQHADTSRPGSLMGSPGEKETAWSFGESCLFSPSEHWRGVWHPHACDEIKNFFPSQCILNPHAQEGILSLFPL